MTNATSDTITGAIAFEKSGIRCGPAGDYIVCLDVSEITIRLGADGEFMEAMPEDEDMAELWRYVHDGSLRLRARHVPILEGWDEIHLYSANNETRHYVIDFEGGNEYGSGDWEEVQP